ncbi:hypothetical protein TZ03_06425 [Pseudomonas sp. 10-1B]|uniref:LysR family transcriptional regulator n=1 Tax=Pseudomonas sp. 10-1B TaxID=1546029 RepID=UPI00061F1C64|nr:LysR family transcriptional regulator [Pseudomonas sp. 10-1B]KIY41737.1 hypothetical protein TZ03_06425 [Pseudomonas sp. 10-1B]
MTTPRRILSSMNRLVAFEAAARRCNFTRAAEELFISQPAISRQIKELEQSVGVALFVRFGTRLELTEAGRRLLSSVTVAFDNIENTIASFQSEVEQSTVIKLRTSVAASNWLMPALSEFYSANPDILLQMICIDDSTASSIADCDIEVRFGSGNWNDGINYPLLDEVIFPVASPEFLRLNPIESMEDLCAVPLLQLANHISPLMSWMSWLPNQDLGKPSNNFIRSYSTYSTLLDAAIYGHGVALGWKYYAAGALARGDLCPVLPLRKKSRLKEFLVVNRQRVEDPNVMRTAEWIKAYAATTRMRFRDI